MGASVLAVSMVLLVLVHITAGAGGGYGAGWNYLTEGNYAKGPSTWKDGHAACGHQYQSPINIHSGDATVDKDLGVLELGNYDVTTNVSFLMRNRDTDIEFLAMANSGKPKDIPQTVTWNGTRYRLYQLHFHWGKETHQGSEHQIDSQQYAAEMHIIHYNDKYDNVGQAINQSDGLLVWGHFLQVASQTHIVNPYFRSLVTDFEDVKNSQENKTITLNLKRLLPEKHDYYYHYTGSLTTPPCFESVKWIVNTNPIRVSEQLMNDEFRSLIDGPMSNVTNTTFLMGDNYRPIQPLNGRTVYANFDRTSQPTCVKASATGITIHVVGMIGSAIAAVLLMM